MTTKLTKVRVELMKLACHMPHAMLRHEYIKEHSPKIFGKKLHRASIEQCKEGVSNILMSEYPSSAFNFLDALGDLRSLFPEIFAAKNVAQNRKFGLKLTLFDHILYALDAASKNNMSLDVRYAVLFHDMGKPKVEAVIDSRTRYYGHEKEGEKLAILWLKRYGFSKEFIYNVGHLCRYHMFDANPSLTDKGVKRLLKRVGSSLIFKLLDLRRADRAGVPRKNINMWKIDNLEKRISDLINNM